MCGWPMHINIVPNRNSPPAVLLRENAKPTDTDIDDCMAGNICRCGTYPRIRRAIHRAAEMQSKGGGK